MQTFPISCDAMHDRHSITNIPNNFARCVPGTLFHPPLDYGVHDEDDPRLEPSNRRVCPEVDDLVARFGKMNFEVDQWATIAIQAMSSHPPTRYEGTRALRYMLSVSGEIPIQAVIETGVVPALASYIGYDDPDLQFEAAWALTNIASGTSEQTATVVESGALPMFMRLLTSTNEGLREQGMWGLGNIAGDRAEYRDQVLQMDGAIDSFIQAMQSSLRISTIRTGVWASSNLCRGKPRPEINKAAKFAPFLAHAIQRFSDDIDICADGFWALDGISETPLGIETVISCGVLSDIIQQMKSASPIVQRPALRVAGQIATGSVAQAQLLLDNGCINSLKTLLWSSKRSIRKDACWVLSNIAAGSATQTHELMQSGIINAIVHTAVNDFEPEVKREAAWVLCNAFTTGGKEDLLDLIQVKALGPVCSMLGSGDAKIAGITLDALYKVLQMGQTLSQVNMAFQENFVVRLINDAEGFCMMRQLLGCVPDASIHEKIHQIQIQFGIDTL